ncbi:hypothetical protein HOY82DRAFT_612630 [Tuber indicum]|nr:hypothetical protein HOY82DRAFT_612630 [Tuber indicum]
MEDNAPAHIHHYHNIPQEHLGLWKLVWPANSPDLSSIETIWSELKDKLIDQIGPRMTARDIRHVLEHEWRNYPRERVNHHIESMSSRMEACIADNDGNNFNF